MVDGVGALLSNTRTNFGKRSSAKWTELYQAPVKKRCVVILE